jgi:predicted MFS family arabinose efflux permease
VPAESRDPAGQPGLRLILLLAFGAGFAVAALYYSQPILALLGSDLGASTQTLGMVPTLTQLGYALGIFLLAPLGDRFDRRTIILVKAVALVIALAVAASAPSISMLLAASLAIGLTATLAQDIVPAAAALASDANRGRAVGTVMTGLLLGILMSRVASGLLAEQFGWRIVYALAAVSIAVFALIAARCIPRFRPGTSLSYGALLGSLAALWWRYPALRRAALAQGLLALGFSAFWSTLAVMLHAAPWHLGSAAAGAFGIAGAAGAVAAPLAGRRADRVGAGSVARFGALLTAAAFFALSCGSLLPQRYQLWLIGAGAVGFDLGVQASLIAHQTLIYGIDPAARSRLNAVLFTVMFIGMSLGAALGSLILPVFGWSGVTALGCAAALGAWGIRRLP